MMIKHFRCKNEKSGKSKLFFISSDFDRSIKFIAFCIQGENQKVNHQIKAKRVREKENFKSHPEGNPKLELANEIQRNVLADERDVKYSYRISVFMAFYD